MKKGRIRPLVICIFQKDDTILVAEGYDPVKDDYFYRPIGGGIEYGEKSAEALIREIREEIETDIFDLQYLGTVENIFTFNGEVGHEIVQVYNAAFVDTSFYTKEVFEGKEDDGSIFKIRRLPISKFQSGELRLVPEDLLDLIKQNNRMIKSHN